MKKTKINNHDKEHKNWSRRKFLMTGGITSLGGLMLGNMNVSAFSPDKLSAALNTADSDRILVLIYLFGGNDSLNTIIPFSLEAGVEKYLDVRPVLKQEHGTHYDDNHLLSGYGTTNYALNSNMNPLMDLWNNDEMHIVQKVGYRNENLSHFVSQNFWFAGAESRSDSRISDGWMGRALEQLYPSFLETPPTVPPAIRIGGRAGHTFMGSFGGNTELSFANPAQFYAYAQRGQSYDTDNLGDCNRDLELAFMRGMANNSLQYADATFDAYNNSTDGSYTPSYPIAPDVDDYVSQLAEPLKIVARLIKGGLGTKVYMVSMGGFDTHGDQDIKHARYLKDLATAIREFHDDLASTGDDERVISFPFSEFGRTVRENTSAIVGTEHGTLADYMLFGKGVNGGFSGTPLDLYDPELEANANWRAKFEDQEGSTDYRSIYATLLQDWLCIDGVVVDYALGQHYPRIPNLIAAPCQPSEEDEEIILGHRPKPQETEVLEIRYGIQQPGRVKIVVHNESGQSLVTLVDEHHSEGTYNLSLSPLTHPFPEGNYFYKMHHGGKQYVRKMVL